MHVTCIFMSIRASSLRIPLPLLLLLLLLPLAFTIRRSPQRHHSNNAPVSAAHILSHPFASRLIVSEHARLIYCPIPKAANSNWKYLIRKFERRHDYTNLSVAHRVNASRFRYLTDYSVDEAHRLLNDASYLKFVFVRDPYQRLLSCYMDKFRNTNAVYVANEYTPFLAQLYSWPIARRLAARHAARPSFTAFVDQLARQTPQQMNAHWMPQTLHCGIGIMPYDFIGRMETLHTDAAYVLRRIGRANERFPSPSQIAFPPSGASSKTADMLYTRHIMLKTRIIYAHDFTVLHY